MIHRKQPDRIGDQRAILRGVRPVFKVSAEWILSPGLFLAATMGGHLLFAADTELTNYKSGINLHFGDSATTATDKGVAYAEEYFYHDKLIDDHKVVYIKADTLISMSHNERNIAGNATGSASYESVGTDVGVIRYKVDGDHRFMMSPFSWAQYTVPVAFADMNYAIFGDDGVNVVGSTGANGYAQTLANKEIRYHRGMLDSVGDEWHTLTLADDDRAYTSNSEFNSSDGKIWYFVVNPKTPSITWRTSGKGQFYTTPPKTYFIPKIYDQTTYFSGTATCELRDINGNNVFYRINGGSFINAGANFVVLNQDRFTEGDNTLEYYYAGNAAFTKTRKVVKNPAYPSAGEAHGNRLWVNAKQWTSVVRPNLTGTVDKKWWIDQWSSGNKNAAHSAVQSVSRSGKREGLDSASFPNALVAKINGMTYVKSGAAFSAADFAKKALLDTRMVLDPVGAELNTSERPVPTRELMYRGYYDVKPINLTAAAYDIIAGEYRADQGFAMGLTAVEDYFIRDTMARWVHMCGLNVGGWEDPAWYKLDGGGMWDTARKVGAAMIAAMMPAYSTPYYGTSGMDGNTTTFNPVTLPTLNHTWFDLFFDNNVTPIGYPALASRIGVNDYLFLADGKWHDRIGYANSQLMGHAFGTYYNLLKLFHPSKKLPNLDKAMPLAAAGQLYGSKFSSSTDYNPRTYNWAILANAWFPTYRAAVAKNTAGTGAIGDEYNYGGPLAVLWYDLDLPLGAELAIDPKDAFPTPPSGVRVVP